jgi:hypothetical protein
VNRRGVALLHLLMIVAIIVLLFVISMARLQGARRLAMVTRMRGDLRALGLHEASYFYDNGVYTDDVGALVARGFHLSPEVTVTVNEATSRGWSATASHRQVESKCYIFVGSAGPVGTAVDEGTVDCG